VLEGKVALSMISWPGEIEQLVPYRLDLAKMWFWLEYYFDLHNRSPQVVLENMLHPELGDQIRPQLGVFETPG
jgi:hypothetical protein